MKNAPFKPRYYKNTVIITDFNCGLASAQIEMRFQNVYRHTAECLAEDLPMAKQVVKSAWVEDVDVHRPPVVQNIYTIPHGNIDFAGYALYSTYRALGKKTRPNIFIHVTDPGEGYSDDRSILITDQNNVMIGPNNGTLGLMRAYLDSRNISYDLFPIDVAKVEAIERLRVGNPTYELPRTFHGRDLFAVVGGLVAGGVDPHCLAPSSKVDYEPKRTDFSLGLQHLPLNVGDEVEFTCFRDSNFGSLRTNICTSTEKMQQLINENAVYEVTPVDHNAGLLDRIFSRHIKFPVNSNFTNLKAGDHLLYVGSTISTYWDERFIELAINRRNIGSILEVPENKSKSMMLKRIK